MFWLRKTGWVQVSTSPPLRLITSGEGHDARRARWQSDRRLPRISAICLHYVWAYMPVFCRRYEKYPKWYRIAHKCINRKKHHGARSFPLTWLSRNFVSACNCNCNCNDNISNAPPTSRPTAHYIVHKCLFIGAQ